MLCRPVFPGVSGQGPWRYHLKLQRLGGLQGRIDELLPIRWNALVRTFSWARRRIWNGYTPANQHGLMATKVRSRRTE